MKRILRITLMVILSLGAASSSMQLAAAERIENVSSEASAKSTNGGILLSATESTTFEIYSITGQRLKSLAVDSEEVRVELPAGCYIVRCSQWSKKVVVK